MTRWRKLGWARRALIAGVALALVPVAAADTAPPPPLDFPVAAPLAVNCATMKTTGVTVELRNDTGTQQVAKLAVSALTDAQGNVLPASQVCGGITADPATLSLDPGTSGLVTLRASKSGVSGSTFTGSLAAAAPGGPAARLALSIAAAPAGTIPPVPLTATVTQTIYRGWPHGKDSLSITVKAKPKDLLALTANQVVGAVDGNGRTGVITYRKGPLRVVNATAGIAHFTITGLHGATGTFTGKVTLVPGDDKTAVTVTIIRKDWWLYPTLAVIAGILLALFSQRLGGVLVSKHKLQARLDATGDDGDDYKKARATLEGKPWAGFELSDIDDQRNTVQDAINLVVGTSYVTIAQSKLDEINADLTKLEQGIAKLGAINGHAQALQDAIDKTAGSADALPLEGSDTELDEPVLVSTARELLIGEALTLAALGKRLTDLDAATTAVTTLGRFEQAAGTFSDQLKDLAAGLGADHKQAVDDATYALAGIWHDLRTAPSVDELANRRVSARLAGIAARIARLWPLLAPEPRPLLAEADVRDLNVDFVLPDVTVGRPPAHPPAEYTPAGVQRELSKARADQTVVVLFSFVVALTTALTALYINKVFGSFWDYVSAVTWGLATQATVTVLAGALDNLGNLKAVSRPPVTPS